MTNGDGRTKALLGIFRRSTKQTLSYLCPSARSHGLVLYRIGVCLPCLLDKQSQFRVVWHQQQRPLRKTTYLQLETQE
ncbi:hypothetical protein F0562_003052 [Nyssa sinensis]|uniref:Uncharacterized protein n=1 Tax=Nyssa sinensis TaxID=561372 RepID=A0A5J5BTG0_9ASTE|nr:hypothetical protein F0562_003052 [Nyssa sinensis]